MAFVHSYVLCEVGGLLKEDKRLPQQRGGAQAKESDVHTKTVQLLSFTQISV